MNSDRNRRIVAAFEDCPDSGARRLARFNGYVLRSAPEACWNWTAGLGPGGYGIFKLATGLTVLAHRVALILSKGLPAHPDLTDAAHSCSNPICCNPAHLRWATSADNQADKWRPGSGPIAGPLLVTGGRA